MPALNHNLQNLFAIAQKPEKLGIGLMSGTSLDGLDIALTQLTEISGKWTYEIMNAECVPYPAAIAEDLKRANKMSVPDFLRLHTSYGHYTAALVKQFMRD